jgi:hypothetical protein
VTEAEGRVAAKRRKAVRGIMLSVRKDLGMRPSRILLRAGRIEVYKFQNTFRADRLAFKLTTDRRKPRLHHHAASRSLDTGNLTGSEAEKLSPGFGEAGRQCACVDRMTTTIDESCEHEGEQS